MAIRSVQKADIPRLIALDHSSTTDHVWQIEVRREPRGQQISTTIREVRLPRPVRLTYPGDPALLEDEWKKKAAIYVAVSDLEPVGYMVVSDPRARSAWITDIVVAPKCRRKGVGTALVHEAHKWAVERGCRQLFLEMQSKNFPGIMMAQKLGYEFCGYNDRYYASHDVSLAFARGV